MIQGLLRSRSLHPACVVRKSIGGRLIALPGIVHVRLIPRAAASPLNFKAVLGFPESFATEAGLLDHLVGAQ
jgi:hypothetical protein